MEEQKTEEKYFHFENVGKNLVTTIIGSVLMCISSAAIIMNWFFPTVIPPIPYIPLVTVGVFGFILLFMRDKAKDYVDIFVKKKIDSSK